MLTGLSEIKAKLKIIIRNLTQIKSEFYNLFQVSEAIKAEVFMKPQF